MSLQMRIAIAGAGVSGFATLGYLVESLRSMPSSEVTIYWLQPPRDIRTENLSWSQRDRLAQLEERGLDPSRLLGGGQVYHPVQPSLFTFNGNSAARGFNFADGRYDNTDYFEWVQANRDWLAALYPDFAPGKGQQRHPEHTLDDIQGTTPRGAFGLYLHAQVMALMAQLPKHITLQIIPKALQGFEQNEQTITLATRTRQLEVDYLVQAMGPRFASIKPEWGNGGAMPSEYRVFNAYPCDRYGYNLPAQVTVVGAGASGIEVALHLRHNLQVEQVTLVSRRAQARLPQVEPTETYECQWFTRDNIGLQPTAKNAQSLLQKELETCYRACGLPYPGWKAIANIEDYPSFLTNYIETTDLSSNHPFAHLMRPVLSFYDRVKDLLPTAEQEAVLQLIDRVKPLFATQSRPCAELLLAGIKAERIGLIAGDFLPEQPIPTVLHPEGTQTHPNCVILATGFTSLPTYSLSSQVGTTRCYQVAGTSLSLVHKRAADVAGTIVSSVSKSLSAIPL